MNYLYGMINMNKIALIGDLHFGVKNFDIDFLNASLDALEKIAEVLKKENVTTIYQLGDMFDNRITMDLNCLYVLKERFSKIFKDFEFYTFVGNHDMYFKYNRSVTSCDLFKDILGIRVITEPTYHKFGEHTIGISPWLVDDECFISDCDILLGHGDIKGSKFDLYNTNEGGVELDNSKYKKVYMGHYHYRDGVYLGTPYQINFKEFGSVPGVIILDENLNETFIENIWSDRHFVVEIYSDKVFYQYTDKKEEFKGILPEYCKIGKIKVVGDNPKTDKIIEYFCSISNIVKVDYNEKITLNEQEQTEQQMESLDFITKYVEKTGDEKLIEIFRSIMG